MPRRSTSAHLQAFSRRLWFWLIVCSFCGGGGPVFGVPMTLTYQGHLVVAGQAFEGAGEFKFALLDAEGNSQWSHDGTSLEGSEPDTSLTLDVIRGGYVVRLGDPSVPNMAALSGDVFGSDELLLRVWFSPGGGAFHQLIPDKAFTSVAFALRSATADFASVAGTVVTVPNIDASKISSGVISSARLDPALARDAEVSAQVAALQAQIDTLSGAVSDFSLPYVAASTVPDDATLLGRGYQRFSTVTPTGWTTGASEGEATARTRHTAVWTGESLIVWGGEIAAGVFTHTGALYLPGEDRWTPVPNLDAPLARAGHAAVWTGTEMLVWGGFGESGYLGDGARFDPATQLWMPLASTGAPSGRTGHVAVWTGDRLVIWGGMNDDGLQADGAQYLPASNTWVPLAVPGAPSARMAAQAVWTGDRIIIFGGEGPGGALGNGAQLLFSAGVPNEWRALSGTAAPAARFGHSLVWTGERAVVFGGFDGDVLLGDGAVFNPSTNAWSALTLTGAPSPRQAHAAVWTGQEMLIVGGKTASVPTSSAGAFDPPTSQWRVLSTQGNPSARSAATIAWTGTEALLFGGVSGTTRLAALERLDPSPTLYLYWAP